LKQLPLLFSPNVASCDNQSHPIGAVGRSQSG
jgi:hypothetical protein